MKKWKEYTIAFVTAVTLLPCVACGGENEISYWLNDTYTLLSASEDGVDCTDDFEAFTATFTENGSLRVVVSYFGALTTRNSTYVSNGFTITETYGSVEYTYVINGNNLNTVFSDGFGEVEVILTKGKEEITVETVDFESILFGDDISTCKIFNYCPAIITETVDGEEIMHIWYCTNKDDGVIMDHIGYRKGVKQENGEWLFSEQQIVLEPTSGTWDARHTCDPAVVRGKFKYHSTEYTYLMAYLGCTTEDYQKNETGIAVSNAPEGPWVKVDELNPIVSWYDDGDYDAEQAKYESYQGTSSIYWGTGMPALLSIDGEGNVILFYQSTLRKTGIQRWNFSDLDNPELLWTSSISHTGIVNSKGEKCNINIPDFAYDEEEERFYVCGVTNEKNPADITTTRVNSHCMVAYIDNVKSLEDLSTLLRSGEYSWEMAGYIGPDDTGYERNHNPGIVRNEYGYLTDSSQLSVVVSTGHNSWNNENIFTYRLYGAVVQVSA